MQRFQQSLRSQVYLHRESKDRTENQLQTIFD
jgi:hypothetical protein